MTRRRLRVALACTIIGATLGAVYARATGPGSPALAFAAVAAWVALWALTPCAYAGPNPPA